MKARFRHRDFSKQREKIAAATGEVAGLDLRNAVLPEESESRFARGAGDGQSPALPEGTMTVVSLKSATNGGKKGVAKKRGKS
jgi:hypothetical protein